MGLEDKTSGSRILECIVFDLFHTLVDPEEFRPKDSRRALRAATLLQIDPEPFSTYWTNTLASRITRSNPIITLVEEYLSKIGKTCSSELLSQVDYELGRYQDLALMKPQPSVISVMKTLTDHGLRLGILSNCDEREVRKWKQSPLSSFFEAVCFSYAIGCKKPDPEAYRLVLERLGALAQRTAYVGDGGSHELEGARKAGLGRIVFMSGFVSRNGLRNPAELESFRRSADFSVDDIRQLPRALNMKDERTEISDGQIT